MSLLTGFWLCELQRKQNCHFEPSLCSKACHRTWLMAETQNSGRFWLSVHPAHPCQVNLSTPDSPVTSVDSSSIAAAASQRFFLFFCSDSPQQWSDLVLLDGISVAVKDEKPEAEQNVSLMSGDIRSDFWISYLQLQTNKQVLCRNRWIGIVFLINHY